jgi:hypothetical protein
VIKDESQQHIDITRAIFYYRLDHNHQLFRYHDSARWNISIYLALLSSPPHISNSTPRSYSHSTSYFSPGGRRFATAYLNAVLETHNSPYTFSFREAFVRLWKTSPYDLFRITKGGQRAYMKKEMIRLRREWEHELDRARASMREDAYWSRVAPFVGCLVAGRVDQGRREVTVTFGVSARGMADQKECGDGGVTKEWNGDLKEWSGGVERERNELLEGLKVPMDGKVVGGPAAEYETMVELTAGLNAVKHSTAKEILKTLLTLL